MTDKHVIKKILVEIIISMVKKLLQIDIKQNARQQIVLKSSEQSTLNKMFQN